MERSSSSGSRRQPSKVKSTRPHKRRTTQVDYGLASSTWCTSDGLLGSPEHKSNLEALPFTNDEFDRSNRTERTDLGHRILHRTCRQQQLLAPGTVAGNIYDRPPPQPDGLAGRPGLSGQHGLRPGERPWHRLPRHLLTQLRKRNSGRPDREAGRRLHVRRLERRLRGHRHVQRHLERR